MAAGKIFPQEYLPNAQGAAYHAKWVKSNPGEASKWATYRDKVLAHKKGQTPPTKPAMGSKYGKALVAAGSLHVSVLDLGTVWPPAPPPGGSPPPDANTAPPLPAVAGSFSGPIIISAGGTYTGNWESTDPGTAAVMIATTEPVIIEDSQIRHLTGGRCIRNEWGLNVDVTVRRCVGWGGRHRFIEVEGHRNFVVENCTMNQTGGIRPNITQSGSTTIIRYNYHLNPRNTPEGFGNFIQLNGTNADGSGTVLIEWNQAVGQHNKCDCEDTISIIGARNGIIRYNMLWHNSLPNNAPGTNGSITFEAARDWEFHNNYIVDSTACPYIQGDDHNIYGHHNRCIQDGYLHPPYDNIQTWATGGWTILSPSTGCHLHDNVFGWTGNGGAREEKPLFQSPGTPHTQNIEWDLNTHLPSPITREMEEDEWISWQNDLVANNITIGAPL